MGKHDIEGPVQFLGGSFQRADGYLGRVFLSWALRDRCNQIEELPLGLPREPMVS